jgi:hypothetical protein
MGNWPEQGKPAPAFFGTAPQRCPNDPVKAGSARNTRLCSIPCASAKEAVMWWTIVLLVLSVPVAGRRTALAARMDVCRRIARIAHEKARRSGQGPLRRSGGDDTSYAAEQVAGKDACASSQVALPRCPFGEHRVGCPVWSRSPRFFMALSTGLSTGRVENSSGPQVWRAGPPSRSIAGEDACCIWKTYAGRTSESTTNWPKERAPSMSLGASIKSGAEGESMGGA